MNVYLDNSATTRVFPEVADLMMKIMTEDFGNPSSMHEKGVEAEKYVREATTRLAKILRVPEKTIYYTSGGTESDNWALIGTAMANRRTANHLIVSAMEHPAIGATADFLEKQGFEVTRLPVEADGRISPEKLAAAVREDTFLVSVMYVNNEIGAVQDIAALSAAVKKVNPHTYFHVDAVQAFGKYTIRPKRMGIDMLSVSSHKLHGPKGVGLLYIDERVKIVPIIYGGGQQNGMRSGTDNVPGIAGFGLAAEMVYKDLDQKMAAVRTLRNKLAEGLKELPDVTIHGMDEELTAPHIVSAAFVGVRSEVLLHTLEDRGIYVSAGSACSTHKRNASPTMQAICAPKVLSEATVRFSLAETTTEEEIDYTLSVLREVLPMLRRYTRR